MSSGMGMAISGGPTPRSLMGYSKPGGRKIKKPPMGMSGAKMKNNHKTVKSLLGNSGKG